ncbi:pyridoxal phosphate-dependent transferase [Crepidotus variabilis]|uniref:Pyridoxal phosphate-dependent transferase n=1 Tax=Crepidotus variabilis TaxID=179855 RepID=A0A9P6E4G4_9AGAR|nr:pyridoxal phosphate-dependent transferase [Crepidotus variabilis]
MLYEGLVLSYLRRYDYQGRVVRLDTFSKTLAPGCRLGWITCLPIFAERIERASETATQAPCGFSQSLVSALLMQWKYDGFIRWAHGLAQQYTRRRSLFIDLLGQQFDLQPEATSANSKDHGHTVYLAYRKNPKYFPSPRSRDDKEVPVFSFVPPLSGMFVWLTFHFDDRLLSLTKGEETIEQRFWAVVAKEGLLIGPGYMFAADPSVPARDHRTGHFRISFSSVEDHVMADAVQRLASAVDNFYNV